jgi:hypothetical protein
MGRGANAKTASARSMHTRWSHRGGLAGIGIDPEIGGADLRDVPGRSPMRRPARGRMIGP